MASARFPLFPGPLGSWFSVPGINRVPITNPSDCPAGSSSHRFLGASNPNSRPTPVPFPAGPLCAHAHLRVRLVADLESDPPGHRLGSGPVSWPILLGPEWLSAPVV